MQDKTEWAIDDKKDKATRDSREEEMKKLTKREP